MPPAHGAAIVETILESADELTGAMAWGAQAQMRERIGGDAPAAGWISW